jgi:hypothetical protein
MYRLAGRPRRDRCLYADERAAYCQAAVTPPFTQWLRRQSIRPRWTRRPKKPATLRRPRRPYSPPRRPHVGARNLRCFFLRLAFIGVLPQLAVSDQSRGHALCMVADSPSPNEFPCFADFESKLLLSPTHEEARSRWRALVGWRCLKSDVTSECAHPFPNADFKNPALNSAGAKIFKTEYADEPDYFTNITGRPVPWEELETFLCGGKLETDQDLADCDDDDFVHGGRCNDKLASQLCNCTSP